MVQSGQVAFAYDYWANNNDCTVELNCLMPNGVFIPLFVSKTSTFNEIKEVCNKHRRIKVFASVSHF